MAYVGQTQTLNTTAFGDLAISEVTGQIQVNFPVNLSPASVQVTVASSGTATVSPPFAVLSTGTSATGSSAFQSVKRLHCKNGQGSLIFLSTIFSAGTSGSQQYIGLGDQMNGFFFGWNGSTFGILYRSSVYGASVSSVTTVDTWTYQSSWNQDTFDGAGSSGITLDPTMGNVYKIQMLCLGFGMVNFFIEDMSSGLFVPVHQLSFLNSYVNPFVSNPNLSISANVQNSGNTSNLSLQVASVSGFNEGSSYLDSIRYSASGTNNGFASNNLVLSIQNLYTFNGIINQKAVLPDFVSIWSSGNNSPVIYCFSLNPVLSTSSYLAVSTGTSVVQYYSPGSQAVTLSRQSSTRTLAHIQHGTSGQVNLSLSSLGIILNPGEVLAISSFTISAFDNAFCSLSWTEEF